MRTNRLLAGVAALAVLVLAACGDDEDSGASGDEFPSHDFTVIVPADAAGGGDTATRQFTPYLADELGVDMDVENRQGAGTTIGIEHFIENVEPDCHAIVLTSQPHLFTAVPQFEVDWSYEDLRPLGIAELNPGVWRVRDDAPWETLEDLVEDAKARPGEITGSTSSASISNNAIGILEVSEATGAEFNVVPFDGGTESRNALLRGEVDFTHAGAFNSLPIDEGTRVIAVQEPENLWPEVTDDATTVNEQLGLDLGTSASVYTIQTHAKCAEDYPERYERLVEAWNNVVQNEELRSNLEEAGASGAVPIPNENTNPDAIYGAFKADSENAIANYERFADRFEQ